MAGRPIGPSRGASQQEARARQERIALLCILGVAAMALVGFLLLGAAIVLDRGGG